MIDRKAIRRYSRALFGLTLEKGVLEQVERDFLRVRELYDEHPEIANLVSNSTVSLAEKEDFVEKVFPPEASKTLIQFLKVLIKKRRFRELPAIQEDFHGLVEEKNGVREIVAITSHPLPETLWNRLKILLEKKTRLKIRLVKKIDPEILGGLILRFKGTEMDASFKTRLESIKQLLLG
ncbi:MAG: ATP synthase F1 subunit delta [Candidatus Omnitrophica bacterium]|nr:ATP synthase F1 subunit delta [Candidatus Omnitrophota bacterium]